MYGSPVTTTPRTFSEAIKVAETVSFEEFALLVAGSSGVSVIRRNKSIRHTAELRMSIAAKNRYVGFECCNRAGYTDSQGAFFDSAVFDFYQVGRLVRVAS